jgi:hypothetical protein
MEAVAQDALGLVLARQREAARLGRLGRVEGGVEAGDLRQVGELVAKRPDGGEVVRLMVRRQRFERGQLTDNLGRQPAVGRESGAAMDDTMAGAGERDALAALAQPTQQEGEGGAVGRDGRQRVAGAVERLARGVGGGEARLRADGGDLAAA